jgi:prophage regulatory protein
VTNQHQLAIIDEINASMTQSIEMVATIERWMAKEEQARSTRPKCERGRPRKGNTSRMEVSPPTNLVGAEPAYYLKLPDVTRITGLEKTSIYVGMTVGTFPKRVLIGQRAVAWKRSDIFDWCEERLRASRQGRQPVWPPPWRESA